MLIEITQEHIDRGVQRSCDSCAVALAVNAVLIEGFSVQITETELSVKNQKHQFVGNRWLPDEVEEFICKFDDGDIVHPQMLSIDIPKELVKC